MDKSWEDNWKAIWKKFQGKSFSQLQQPIWDQYEKKLRWQEWKRITEEFEEEIKIKLKESLKL